MKITSKKQFEAVDRERDLVARELKRMPSWNVARLEKLKKRHTKLSVKMIAYTFPARKQK